MKKIALKGKYGDGKYVIVDDESFALVKDIPWTLTKLGYPMKTIFETGKTHSTRKAKTIYLHKLLVDCPKGMVVDHKNLNKLDNRLSNLRVCSHSQNHSNSKLQKNNTSGFKGVTKAKNKWHARIKLMGKDIHLGNFSSKSSAAKAYNEKALELFGEFSLGNRVKN